MREAAGLKLQEAGRPLQRSAATISRLENGKVKPRLLDVKALLDLYASRAPHAVTDEERHRVEALATEGRRNTWFSPFGDVLTGSLVNDDDRRLLELEADATRILSYQPELIPGLLQTPAYIRAIADTYYPDANSRERDRFIEFRLERQRAVARRASAIDLHVVIGEQAFRRSIGGPEVMREQLQRLIELLRAEDRNVRIQIAPVTLAVRGAIGGPFLVMSFEDAQDVDFVYLESRDGANYLEGDQVLNRYRKLFDGLAAAALDEEASLATLEEAVKLGS
jgi:hypothetical protein